jgi:magnesium transporter
MADLTPTPDNQPALSRAPMDAAFLARVQEAVEAGDAAALQRMLEPLEAEEFADLLHLIPADHRDDLLELHKAQLDPDVLPLLDESVREDVVEQLDTKDLTQAIANLETDDAVELIEAMDTETQREVLSALPLEERDALRTALSYPEDSAGRLMQRELLAVPDGWSVQQCLDTIRARRELPEAFYDIFVVNQDGMALGSVPLHRLLTAPTGQAIRELMDEQSQRIPVLMPEKEVAYIFHRYGLVSAPVEDESRRLVGMITIDDVIDLIEDRATEELVHLSGVSEPDFYRDTITTARSRFTWLFVNLFTAIVTSRVISAFENTLQSIVVLAILMPIVASQGGNAGTQTLAVAVRGLALRELTWMNAWRFVAKEASVGALNGFFFAVLIGLFTGLWYGDWPLSLVIGAAMIINLVMAALAGGLIPLLLHRLKVDPAISSSALVTTVTDWCGYACFLGLATLFLLK